MNVILGNPAGLWMLLGIPALLAIHWLQKTYRTVYCPTLFLLPRKETVNKAGLRFRRLDRSRTLLLQILTVLLLTWLVSAPRFLNQESVLRVVIVLDSSDSMSAFVPEVRSALTEQIDRYKMLASQHEWILMESDLQTPTLYSGGEENQLFSRLSEWIPGQGGHEPVPSLDVARELAGKRGIVLYVSDHVGKLPEAVDLLSVGSAIENVGFAGLVLNQEADALKWKVLVKNYSKTLQKRKWWLEIGGKALPESEIQIRPGRSHLLQGEFPQETDRMILRMNSDRFPLDDQCPVLRPIEKLLQVKLDVSDQRTAELFSRIIESSDIAQEVALTDAADLTVQEGVGTNDTQALIAFAPQQSAGAPRSSRVVPVAENHELVKGLNWKGLLAVPSAISLTKIQFSTLVWQGDQPLMSFRKGAFPTLAFHFHPAQSNASREPSFALVTNRFLQYAHETVRLVARQVTRRNLELRQHARVPLHFGAGQAMLFHSGESFPLQSSGGLGSAEIQAPAQPGFFQIKQKDNLVFEGAVRFSDVLEADFTNAVSTLKEGGHENDLMIRNSYRDPAEGIWMLLLGILCLLTWGWRAGGVQ